MSRVADREGFDATCRINDLERQTCVSGDIGAKALSDEVTNRKRIRLSKAQLRWLTDSRKYSHPYNDRTFRALIKNGVVRINEAEHDRYGTGRAGYIVTELGQKLIAEQLP